MKLVAPLHRLTQKSVKFEFTGAAKEAFEHLKCCLSHADALALPDPKLPFEVVVDACDFGCSVVLLQKQSFTATGSAALSTII